MNVVNICSIYVIGHIFEFHTYQPCLYFVHAALSQNSRNMVLKPLLEFVYYISDEARQCSNTEGQAVDR